MAFMLNILHAYEIIKYRHKQNLVDFKNFHRCLYDAAIEDPNWLCRFAVYPFSSTKTAIRKE